MKLKLTINELMALIMLLTAIGASAQSSFFSKGFRYEIKSEAEKTCMITGPREGNVLSAAFTIPSLAKHPSTGIDYTVVEIGRNAFLSHDEIISLTIPASVMQIGPFAFSRCGNLEKITFESASTTLEFMPTYNDYGSYSGAFADCPLNEIILGRTLSGDGTLWNLKWGLSDQYGVYKDNFHITCLTILDGTDISGKDGAMFDSFQGICNLSLGKNLTGDVDFAGYGELRALIMKDAAPKQNQTFTDLQKIRTTVYIPAGALATYRETDGWRDFSHIEEYEGEDMTPPAPVQFDFEADGLYYKVLDLSRRECSVTCRELRKGIPYSDCSGDIVIPSSVCLSGIELDVIGIEREAFNNCDGITSVVIPSSLNEIGYRAFYNCLNLKDVVIEVGSRDLRFGYVLAYTHGPGVYETFSGCPLETVSFGRCLRILNDHTTGMTVSLVGLYANQMVIPDGASGESILYSMEAPDGGFHYPTLIIGSLLKSYPWNFSLGSIDNLILRAETPWPCPRFASACYKETQLLVPKGCLKAYRAADGWKQFINISESAESGIGDVSNNNAEKTVTGRYDLYGREVSDDYRGVTVIRYSDGTAVKALRQ